VTGRPGDLIGLPVLGDTPADAVALRYVLALLAVAGAALALRGRRVWMVVAVTAFVAVAAAFWTASMARPYGLFADAAVTRVAAHTATARLPGDDGALIGEGRPVLLPVALARLGAPAEVLIALPTLLPLAIVPLLALTIAALWRRPESAEAAVLVLGFATSEAAALRGIGFLPGVWSHPSHSPALVAAVAAALAAERLPWPRLRLPVAVLATLSLALLPAGGPSLPAADRWLAVTLEQGPWLLLGGYGLLRTFSPAALALVAAAAALFVVAPQRADAWATHSAFRIGLILASTRPALDLLRAAAAVLPPRPRRERGSAGAERLGLAALLLLTLPGGFVARWTPPALDPTMAASQAPLSTNLMPALDWVRAHVPEDATCVASPDYAPLVAVMGGRRVLRAPELWDPPDDQRRRRAERMLLAGREEDLARRYQIGCVFFAASDVGWLGTTSAEALDRVNALRRVYADAYVRVYTPAPRQEF
jgi:hypothetical protein